MQPTPSVPPAPTPAPTFAEPLVEFVRRDRPTTGYVLLGLAALLLALCGWTVVKTSRTTAEAEGEKSQKKTDDPFALDDTPVKVKNPARTESLAGAVLSGGASLAALAAGVWLLVAPPPLTEAKGRRDARTLILAVGGALGGLLIVAGIVYAYLWSGSLAEWTEKGQTKQAKWVLYPLLMVVGGAALMFLGAQPARAEERNDRTLRRWVYGSNFGLSVLLVVVALLVANLIVGPRLPNKLDTTTEGFYSLSTGTSEFLGRLDQPVTAYAIMPESGARGTEDIRRLLQNCQDAANSKFQLRVVSPTTNKSEYRTLVGKYPVLEVNEFGVLLTVGEDEKRHSFIRDDEFTKREGGAPGADSSRSFVGEERVMRELQFLLESEKKAVVYFTQSAGELDVSGAPNEELSPKASGGKLRAYLERSYLEVKPLKFDPAAPKVPDDATVVVVAEPQSPLPDAQVAALKQYMTEARGGKKGKLVVLASARFGANDKVTRTGLEPLLQEFNVRLGDRMILSEDTRDFEPQEAAVIFAPTAIRARHPVAVALGEKAAFLEVNWRPVAAVAQGGNPAYRATPLLMTLPGRTSWVEDERVRDLNRVAAELNSSRAVRDAKQLTDSPRVVGAVVSEGEAGRLAVFGNGLIVCDAPGRRGQGGGDPISFDLMGGTIDWLRDRPSLGIGIEAKKYKTFTLPATADETRGLWVPLFFSLIAIAGAGASVWVVRRR